VSIWLDDLSRDRLESGALGTLIATRDVVGVTTNPTIFASAISGTTAYDTQLRSLSAQGATVAEAVDSLIASDIAHAATVLEPTYHRTHGLDGRVSIEVDPTFAYQAHQTFERASYLWTTLNQPNVMIKIPATSEGIDAIAEATASGISVNVTLLFSIDIYRLVIRAYLSGLERAQLAGHDLATIFSVASFFVSRVDAEVDGRLGNLETPDAAELRGTMGVANARLAYRVYQEEFSSPRARRLLARGAHVQRLLWASTGVKDPDLPDTFYVDELIAPETIITLPPATLEAFADHSVVSSDAITGRYDEAVDTFRRLKAVGISYEKVTDKLLAEGVSKFEASWRQLNHTVAEALYGPH
jgi:transaldolase